MGAVEEYKDAVERQRGRITWLERQLAESQRKLAVAVRYIEREALLSDGCKASAARAALREIGGE